MDTEKSLEGDTILKEIISGGEIICVFCQIIFN